MQSYRATVAETTNFQRVSHARPCVICGKFDWCTYGDAYDGRGTVCQCMRVSSDRPCKGGGWLHLTNAAPATSAHSSTPAKLSGTELVLINRQCRADLTPRTLKALTDRLQVSDDALRRLGVGWNAELHAFTFPMRDADGRIVGLRTRHADGRKQCLTGSKLGLITPGSLVLPDAAGDPPDLLLVTEGESDAAAALDLGFAAIARPGCEACRELVAAYVRRLKPGRVGLVADADPPGQRGADKLARLIAGNGTPCRVFTPDCGAKDLRAWKLIAGNDAHALMALLDAPADRTEVLS